MQYDAEAHVPDPIWLLPDPIWLLPDRVELALTACICTAREKLLISILK